MWPATTDADSIRGVANCNEHQQVLVVHIRIAQASEKSMGYQLATCSAKMATWQHVAGDLECMPITLLSGRKDLMERGSSIFEN